MSCHIIQRARRASAVVDGAHTCNLSLLSGLVVFLPPRLLRLLSSPFPPPPVPLLAEASFWRCLHRRVRRRWRSSLLRGFPKPHHARAATSSCARHFAAALCARSSIISAVGLRCSLNLVYFPRSSRSSCSFFCRHSSLSSLDLVECARNTAFFLPCSLVRLTRRPRLEAQAPRGASRRRSGVCGNGTSTNPCV